MILNSEQIAKMIDLSAVKAQDDDDYIHALVSCAKKYCVIAVIPLPSRLEMVLNLMGDDSAIAVGGAVGFPSGGNTTSVKVAEAIEQIQLGCQELDMVMNIGMHVSGRYHEVEADIHAIVDIAEGIPVKVILECHYLTKDQIRKACDLCIGAGATWVKTGTGWAPTGATIENVTLIKSHVGDSIGVKAAGGIRDLEMLIKLYQCGARRFGLGLNSGQKILEQAFSLPGGKIELSLPDKQVVS